MPLELSLPQTLSVTHSKLRDGRCSDSTMTRLCQTAPETPHLPCSYLPVDATARAHLTHIISAVTVATKDIRFRPLYDKLRNAYNPMRPPDFRAIPSFEEWRGMTEICDHLYCR